MNKNIQTTLVLLSALALGGCGLFGKKETPTAGTTGDSGAESSTSGYSSETPPGPVEIGGEAGSGPGGLDYVAPNESPVPGQPQLAKHTIYFEFDSTEINEEGKGIVATFAQYLTTHPAARLRLDGHADERGTREYNVGLGERRAQAVLQALTNAGVSPAQLSVTSAGEERPADPGHDEAAWAKNRRVEIVR